MTNINNKKYTDFIIDIVKKIPVIPVRLLIIALINCFEELEASEELAFQILKKIQCSGHILLTDNGWALTKKAYRFYSNDRYPKFDLRSDCRIGNVINIYDDGNPQKITESKDVSELIKSSEMKKIIDALWVAFDLLPESKDFIPGMEPWQIMFCTKYDDDPAQCYEIIKIDKGMERIECEKLNNLRPIIDPNEREKIIRIAILDDENYAYKIPYIGFRHICVLNDKSDTGYTVVENRDENIWKDCD